jgi:voltage-gated sodium channel
MNKVDIKKSYFISSYNTDRKKIIPELKKLVESSFFEKTIIFIIILNAISLGLETSKSLSEPMLLFLKFTDQFFLGIFIAEITLKLIVYRKHFFTDAWRVFDFSIVALACFPSSGAFSVLRSLRVLRTLRMISVIPSLKKVVNGLLAAIPGLGAVVVIIGIIFYVGAVMATNLFGPEFPKWFGTIGKSAYSLFQIMTLESWSMGIVRPVMDKFPYAWTYFLPFILITTFTMLNLFIAVIVNAMQAETDASAQERADIGHRERQEIFSALEKINQKLDRLE